MSSTAPRAGPMHGVQPSAEDRTEQRGPDQSGARPPGQLGLPRPATEEEEHGQHDDGGSTDPHERRRDAGTGRAPRW